MVRKTHSAQTSKEVAAVSSRKLIISYDPKGGSGKTTVSRGAVYALMQNREPFTIVDADHENPDVYKEHARWDDEAKRFKNRRDHIDVISQRLRAEDDFIELGNTLEQATGTVLLNTPAGSGSDLLEFWPDILNLARATDRSVITLYPIDRGRDTVESLADYVDTMIDDVRFPHHRMVVFKNLFFGAEPRFVRFDEWAQAHKPPSMLVRVWPELNERVVDKLVETRSSLDEDEKLTIVERSALQRYQQNVLGLLNEIGVGHG